MRNILLIFGLFYTTASFSQTTAEWLRQKKTQRKYLVKQIVAFQTYLGHLKKGYDIAGRGISSIQNIKSGQLNLHSTYFESFKNVSPNIKSYRKIVEIVVMQKKVMAEIKSLVNLSRQSGLINKDERDYVVGICEVLLLQCVRNTEELSDVVTSGVLEMKDNERIERIDKIQSETQDRVIVLRNLGNGVSGLIEQRLRESAEIEISRLTIGLK